MCRLWEAVQIRNSWRGKMLLKLTMKFKITIERFRWLNDLDIWINFKYKLIFVIKFFFRFSFLKTVKNILKKDFLEIGQTNLQKVSSAKSSFYWVHSLLNLVNVSLIIILKEVIKNNQNRRSLIHLSNTCTWFIIRSA